MLNLFEPTSKVQKDRRLIQKTDKRMAKYSRRGIISNFLIYSLCLTFEQTLIQQYKNWVVVLTLGLLAITIWRGYLLFRMGAIYPRGPAAWRSKYFLATLVGAAWWGLILSTFTVLLDLQGESALLWLYTVVFFSTTAHAFAPYQRFLSVYQFLGLVPAAVCTFFIGELIGLFYGFILLFFYWVLKHHCELMSQNYWDRLEAHYSLTRKTESLEEEKRDTRASVQLSKEYLQVLGQKMHKLLYSSGEADSPSGPVTVASQRALFERLYRNVNDFQRILTKDFTKEEHVFNARHYLQNVMRGLLEEAENKGVELETALSPALPARLIGDSKRLGQVIETAVRNVLQRHQQGVIIVEFEFIRAYEHAGELLVTVARQTSQSTKKSFFHSEHNQASVVDLDLVLAKGIADVLGGSLEVDELGANDGKNMRFRVPLNIAEVNARPEFHRLEYKGRPLLLIHHNPRWLDHKRLELDTMGFEVQTTSRYKRGLQELSNAVIAGTPFEVVVYYAAPGDDASVHFCNELISSNELKRVHQFVVCSEMGRKFFSERVVQMTPMIHFVEKPAGFFEFDLSFSGVFELQSVSLGDAAASAEKGLKILWVALGKNFDNTKLYDSGAIDIHRVGDVKQIAKHLDHNTYDLAIVEYTGTEKPEGIGAIREHERNHEAESLVPIIGVGAPEVQREMLAWGADHVVDIESLVGGDTRVLRYWAEGRHL